MEFSNNELFLLVVALNEKLQKLHGKPEEKSYEELRDRIRNKLSEKIEV